MATTSPARIEDDLYASAKLAGDALSRSASQQIGHWARIGREVQASASISHREIADVLRGRRSYDGLNAKEQAVVRAEWAERMALYRGELDLGERFRAERRTWVELDEDGHVVEHGQPVAPALETPRKAGKAGKAVTATKRAATPRGSTRSRAVN